MNKKLFNQIRSRIEKKNKDKKSRVLKKSKQAEYFFNTCLPEKTYIDLFTWLEYYNKHFPESRLNKKNAVGRALGLLFKQLENEITGLKINS